jgi:uncharacterized protein (DUF1697 family)
MSSTSHVAFLRGINVGGNTLIKMAEMKKAFEAVGLKNIVPVLASGNVVFERAKADRTALAHQIEQVLAKRFKVQPVAILRTAAQIAELVKSNPFKNARLSSQTKVHVTFLAQETNLTAKFPLSLSAKDFQIFQVSPGEICSAVDLSGAAGTSELMRVLEKQFGKTITTRTWATVEKVAAAMQTE